MKTSTIRFEFNPEIVESHSRENELFFKPGMMPEVDVHVMGYNFIAHANSIHYQSAKCGGTQILLDDCPRHLKEVIPTVLRVPEEAEFISVKPQENI